MIMIRYSPYRCHTPTPERKDSTMIPGKILGETTGLRVEKVGIDDTITTEVVLLIVYPGYGIDYQVYQKDTQELCFTVPISDVFDQLSPEDKRRVLDELGLI